MFFSSALYDYSTAFTINSLYIPQLDKMKMTWINLLTFNIFSVVNREAFLEGVY